MAYPILFIVLWAVLFGAYAVMLSAVPTTVRIPNTALLKPAIVTGVIALVLTLMVSGIANIFT